MCFFLQSLWRCKYEWVNVNVALQARKQQQQKRKNKSTNKTVAFHNRWFVSFSSSQFYVSHRKMKTIKITLCSVSFGAITDDAAKINEKKSKQTRKHLQIIFMPSTTKKKVFFVVARQRFFLLYCRCHCLLSFWRMSLYIFLLQSRKNKGKQNGKRATRDYYYF